MYCEEKIDNVLITQKDELIKRINNLFDGSVTLEKGATSILDSLDTLRPLWAILGYSYKGTELCNRITQEIDDALYSYATIGGILSTRPLFVWDELKNRAESLAVLFDMNRHEYMSPE